MDGPIYIFSIQTFLINLPDIYNQTLFIPIDEVAIMTTIFILDLC